MKRGTYCLVMKLDEETTIPVGKRPPVKFPAGYYCYVGSAMNGLEKRICRHMSREKKLHWHIDWFLEHASIVDIKSIESETRLECGLSQDIAAVSDGSPARGFGSSDCTNCRSHLHYFRVDPSSRISGVVEKWKSSSRPIKKEEQK